MSGRKHTPKRVNVGSGITSYRREETLYDKPHLDGARAGDEVPASVRMDPARPILNLRWEIEETCLHIFEECGLPSPFSMIDPDGILDPVDWRVAIARGAEYVESLYNSGYWLAAHHYCPTEDHSKLWYASRMSITLAQIDIKTSLIGSCPQRPEEITLLTQSAVELGRLECEFQMKFKHEKNAELGREVRSGGAAGAEQTARAHAPRTAEILARMQVRIDAGKTISAAARIVKEVDGLGTSVDSNRKLWTRNNPSK